MMPKRGFEAMGYAVSKKDHDMWDESEIYFRGRPVYVTGDRRKFYRNNYRKGTHGFVMVRKNYGSSS